ncbi:hypothetical protein DMP15_28220 [Pseudonocardia sp. UM4_GMWB1]
MCLLGTVVAVQIQPGGDEYDQPAARQRGGVPPGGDSGPEVPVVELLARCTEAEPVVAGDHTGPPRHDRRRPQRVRGHVGQHREPAPEQRRGDHWHAATRARGRGLGPAGAQLVGAVARRYPSPDTVRRLLTRF